MEIGKIKFRVMVTIFIIALLVPIVMIVKEEVVVSMAIDKTRKILSNISAEEMQEKVIEKLEESEININTSSLKTTIGAFQKVDEDIVEACTYSKDDDDAKKFVYAFITDKKERKGIAVPLFKIESDSDGNFKRVEYINDTYNNYTYKAIDSILKEEYGLERGMGYYGMRYARRYEGSMHKPRIIGDKKYIKYKDTDFAIEIMQEILDSEYYSEYTCKSILNEPERLAIWGILD